MLRVYLFLMFLLSSCSYYKFDDTEYDQIVNIRLLSDVYYKNCDKLSVDDIKVMKLLTDKFQYYTKNKTGRNEVYSSSIMLNDITRGLNYNMSEAYCKAKFDNISRAADRIAKTLGEL